MKTPVLPGKVRALLGRARRDPVAATGLVLLLAGVLFAAGVLFPAERELRRLAAAQRTDSSAAAAPPALPSREALPALQKAVHVLAAASGADVSRLSFRSEQSGEETTLNITLSLSGGYPAVSGLMAGALRLVPGASLQAIRLQRVADDGSRISGEASLRFRFAPVRHAPAAVPVIPVVTAATPAGADLFAVSVPAVAGGEIPDAGAATTTLTAEAPPVEPPPLPFRFLGRILSERQAPVYVFEEAGELRVVNEGAAIGKDYRFVGFAAGQLEFRYRPLGRAQRLPVGELR